jgi:hypothetical protein
MKEFDGVKLGDTVIFRTVLLETFVSKNIRTIPPPMIIIDIEREFLNNVMTITDQTKEVLNPSSKIKVFCIWFSHYLNRFEKKWIYLDLVHIINNEKKEENFKLGNTVCLKSVTYINFLKIEIEKQQAIKNEAREEKDKTNPNAIDNIYFKAVISFLSPKMIVTGIEQVPKKELKPFHDNITGELKRNSPSIRVKCIWHDGSTGKYSEDWFAKEALILADNLSLITNGQGEAIAALENIFPPKV